MTNFTARLATVAAMCLATPLSAACANRRAWSTASPGAIASDEVRAEYDAATDSTWVHTPLMPLGGGLEVYAGFRFPGDTLTMAPAELRLVFQQTSTGPRWSNASGRTLVLWLDDSTRVDVGATRYQRQVLAGRGPVTARVTEWVWADIPSDIFRRLAGARKVEGTIATTHFTLRPEQLTTLRVLVKFIEPYGRGAP